ncbi:MAG: glycosyltransferase family 2 protein [Eubacterium sp.]|nr:glycosyltransferase family 2 protein [Eubacterium sp.]
MKKGTEAEYSTYTRKGRVNEKRDALITIIVPIYNVERYLHQCVNSLLNQSLQNHKIVLVNDGSKDHSGEIAEFYAHKYPDIITYLSQKNAGQGAARNLGLRYVHTPYVIFLDSDDWMMPRTVEHVTREIENGTDDFDIGFMMPVVYNMSSCGYEDWRDNDYVMKIFQEKGGVLNARQAPELYGTQASICRCVFRFSFLRAHHFRFPEKVKWEDVFPHFYLLYWARRCVLLKEAGFFYRVNSGTQTTSNVTMNRMDIIPVFSSVFIYAIKHDWTETELAYIFSMMMDFILWFLHATNRNQQMELAKGLHDMCRTIPKTCFKAYVRILKPSMMNRLIWHGLCNSLTYRLFGNHHKMHFVRQMYQTAEIISKCVGGKINE